MAFDESLSYLLEERRIATLTTFDVQGMPHVTAVWFLWQNGALYLTTNDRSGKGRNLSRDPRMALCIECREAGREAGLSASGRAELLTGEKATALAGQINGKYLTPAALNHPVVGAAFSGMSNLVVKLVPERWISWDMAALGDALFPPGSDASGFFHPTLK